MKILCKVSVERNNCASLTTPKQQSTLALSCEKGSSHSHLTIFNNEYKLGLRYKLNGNVEAIFKKFIGKGKSTIVLRNPHHSILIESPDSSKLKLFVQAIEIIAANKVSAESRLFLPTIAKPMSAKKVIKKLKITKKDDIPSTGLPKQLEFLIVNDFNFNPYLNSITKLRNLTELTMSAANLVTLPKEFAKLSNLRFCDLSANKICRFDWLNGSIQDSLIDLNLSRNQIRQFPNEICFVDNLRSLNLSDNCLEQVPRFIHNLKKLLTLNLSSNAIEYLPSTIHKLRLQNFDITNNKFRRTNQNDAESNVNAVKSLLDLAGVVVLRKVKFDKCDVPLNVYYYLRTAVQCDVCRRFVLDSHVWYIFGASLAMIMPSIAVSYSNQFNDVYVKNYFCSGSCLKNSRSVVMSRVWL